MKKTITLVALLASGFGANAELVQSDWKVTGDQLAVYDDASGLTWLSLTQTADFSIDSALLETSNGGLFDGFRVATQTEVRAVLVPFFELTLAVEFSGTVAFNQTGDAVYSEFQTLFGELPNLVNDVPETSTYAFHYDDSLLLAQVSGTRADWASPTVNDYVLHDGWAGSMTTTASFSSGAGVWLLSDAPLDNVSISNISVPCLGIAGILAFASFLRRKV